MSVVPSPRDLRGGGVPHRNLAALASTGPSSTISLTTVFDIAVPVLLLVLLGLVYIQAASVNTYSSALPEVLLIIGLTAVAGLTISLRTGSTLFMVTFYFCYVFFAAAPLQQYSAMWRDILFDDDVAITTAILCLIFTVAGLATLGVRGLLPPPKPIEGGWGRSILDRLQNVGEGRLTVLMLLTAPVTIGLIGLYNTYLFTSREAFARYSGSIFPKELTIVVTSFIHPFTLIAAAVGLYIAYRRKALLLEVVFFVLLLMALVIYNPFVTPRFRLSAVLVFCALVFVGWNRARSLFMLLLVGTALSPILNELRFERELTDERDLTNFLVHMDYDAFTMIGYTIRYVWWNGIDYGNAVLSAFLFFVPRGIWTGKSDHAAKIMFDFLNTEAGVTIDNLSTPPIAEGFFAFGVVGALAATLIFFYLIFKIERRAENAPPFAPATLIAALSPMYVVIVLRGPLIVGVSEWIGAVSALFGVLWILGFFKRQPTLAVPGVVPNFRQGWQSRGRRG